MRVIDRIKQLADERSTSLFQLARESGIDYRSLMRNCRKGYEPSLATVRKLCITLNISLSDFFSGVA